MKTQKWIVFNDTHFPFQDDTCLNLMLDFGRGEKPDGYIILGDLVDCYQCSDFNQDVARIGHFQDDVDLATEFIEKLRKQNPKAKIVYIEGNHEKRLQKYTMKHPEVSGVRAFTIPSLLNLKDFGVQYFWGKDKKAAKYNIGDMWFYHGHIVRMHSGYSAKAMFDTYGVTLMCGHTHRDGKYTKRTETGHFAAWENYCMCGLEPEYCAHANWTQGFSLITFVGPRPYVEQIPIIGGKYIYGGKLHKDKTITTC